MISGGIKANLTQNNSFTNFLYFVITCDGNVFSFKTLLKIKFLLLPTKKKKAETRLILMSILHHITISNDMIASSFHEVDIHSYNSHTHFVR